MAKNPSKVNLKSETEEEINRMINTQFCAAITYSTVGSFFMRDDVALSNFADYFRLLRVRHDQNARRFLRELTIRGGRFVPMEIKPLIQRVEFSNAVEAIKDTLDLEKKIFEALEKLHKRAVQSQDPQLTDLIEGQFLHDQVKCIKKLANHLTNLHRTSNGISTEYIYDAETISWSVKKMTRKMFDRVIKTSNPHRVKLMKIVMGVDQPLVKCGCVVPKQPIV